eukprot:5695789-Prymnesium_polylepis.3
MTRVWWPRHGYQVATKTRKGVERLIHPRSRVFAHASNRVRRQLAVPAGRSQRGQKPRMTERFDPRPLAAFKADVLDMPSSDVEALWCNTPRFNRVERIGHRKLVVAQHLGDGERNRPDGRPKLAHRLPVGVRGH